MGSSPEKKSNNSESKVIVGYFLDETGFQGPTVSLLKHIEEAHPDSIIELVDFTKYTNSSSFSQTAKIFGLKNPLRHFVDNSQVTNWVEVPKKIKHFEFESDRFRDAVESDLFSSFKTDPLPTGFIRKLLERKFVSNGKKIYSATVEMLSKGGYEVAYVLNGRHSSNAAFLIACKENFLKTYFWESGPTFDSVYLCNHTVHDFFANRAEANSLDIESENEGLAKAEQWFETRLKNKGETAFNAHWNSEETSDFFKKNRAQRRITYFSSSTDEYMSLGELSPPRLWENQYESLENLKLGSRGKDITLTVRMHPNTINKSAKYCIREVTRLLALRETFPNIEIVWPNAKIDSYELLKSSDLVLSSGSTVALESMYLGRPTYHVDHSSYFHASSKTMIDYSLSIDELISVYSVKKNRRVALIEIALLLWHERLRVEPEDQVKGWNLFFSAISYRDVFRILNQAFAPIRKLTNKFIFGVGELFLLHLRSPDKQ